MLKHLIKSKVSQIFLKINFLYFQSKIYLISLDL